MIVYIDSSALLKRYIAESGSTEIDMLCGVAAAVGTCAVTRVEIAAALAKLVRMEILPEKVASTQLERFRREWSSYVRLEVSERIVERADTLAWRYHLRGYDAVQLSSALIWKDSLATQITLATFDKALWDAANRSGVDVFPSDLNTFASVLRRN